MKFSMFSASFEARPLSANFFIISHVFQLVKNFFQLFSKRFFCPFPCEPMPRIWCCFVLACLPDSLIILPKIYALVNGFLHLFLPFFDFFFTRVLRAFSRPETSSTRPLANTCFGVFAGGVQGTAEQGKARAEQKTIMYEKRFTRLQCLQKYGYLHTPHTCPEFL